MQSIIKVTQVLRADQNNPVPRNSLSIMVFMKNSLVRIASFLHKGKILGLPPLIIIFAFRFCFCHAVLKIEIF